MKFLIDKSEVDVKRKMALSPSLVAGQLLTPLTGYADWGGPYAIDNGAYSGLNYDKFMRLLIRQRSYGQERLQDCIFVSCPDVVGNFRRTLEIWKRRHVFYCDSPHFQNRMALVIQNGAEDMEIPWDEFRAFFIGGTDPWKDSQTVKDIVKTGKALGKHGHVGRVNTTKRYQAFAELGCDTCDGSGVAMYDHMIDKIQKDLNQKPDPGLFDKVVDA